MFNGGMDISTFPSIANLDMVGNPDSVNNIGGVEEVHRSMGHNKDSSSSFDGNKVDDNEID